MAQKYYRKFKQSTQAPIQAYIRKFENLEKELSDAAWRGAESVARLGENSMKRTIRENGTGFSRFRFAAGIGRSDGRERSGLMYDSVKSRVKNKGYGDAKAQFGWLDTYRKYFSYQERGFKNYWKFAGFGSGKNKQGSGQKFADGMQFQLRGRVGKRGQSLSDRTYGGRGSYKWNKDSKEETWIWTPGLGAFRNGEMAVRRFGKGRIKLLVTLAKKRAGFV
jgi:hypothetical protein